MKSILMATDLSARSDRAFDRAISLAREHGAALTIAHVVDEDLPILIADAQEQAAIRSIQAQIDALKAEDKPAVSIKVMLGRPYLDILEMSEQSGADLIVLGMHRAEALADMFRGTTAERIIRASTAPVLLVKDRAVGPYRKVMIGVDFSAYSKRALEFAVRFVPTGEFQLVHAYDVPYRGFLDSRDTRREVGKKHETQLKAMVEEEMDSFAASQDANAPKLEQIVQAGSVREVIHRQIGRSQPDLLAVGTHGRTGVAHAVLGSVAEDLLRDPPCDVLAVKAW